MDNTSRQIREIVGGYAPQLERILEGEFSFKPLPHKWSRKEILGHLVDSAQNNLRRFIVAQYEDSPNIVYRQEDWVAISHYQDYPTRHLIQIWKLVNLHICQVLEATSAEQAKRLCRTGGLQAHSIEWLAEDYIKHLLHHLHQILELEPVAYP
ncbi:MAG TPA: DinB family protein [Puia sp.]|nr:DinB family protein [Puia sp.]